MDTFTLRTLLRSLVCNCKILKTYIIAKDQIERIDFTKLPFVAIINTEPISVKYGHWVCVIVFSLTKSESFCSYGYALSFYGIELPNVKNIVNNGRQLQSDFTKVCGMYCLLYLSLRANNYSLNHFNSLFSQNKNKNDRIVLNFYKKIKKKRVECGGQLCTSKQINLIQ